MAMKSTWTKKKLEDERLKQLHDIALKRKLSFDQRNDALGLYQPKSTNFEECR